MMVTKQGDGSYSLSVSREYLESPEDIYSLIRDGKLFRLTGADTLTFEFIEGAPFELRFTHGGAIRGRIIELIPNSKILLEWDVEGFGRLPERGTEVCITISRGASQTRMTIEHNCNPTEQSANAKRGAWTEILSELMS